MSRSRVHMLMVAAACVEANYGNKKLIEDLRAAAAEEAKRVPEGRTFNEKERVRVERQRTLLTMCGDGRAVESLKAAMMQRVYDLMWIGDCTAADAVAEFLAQAEVDKVFSAWETDQQEGGETIFYERTRVPT